MNSKVKVLDKLNKYYDDGIITLRIFSRFTLDDIAKAIQEDGEEAYKTLGYKNKQGFISLLDRNIHIKRPRGASWVDILTSNKLPNKLILHYGIDDTGESSHYYVNKEGNRRIYGYYAAYTTILKKVIKGQSTICDEWKNSLKTFRTWYEENHTKGARIRLAGNHYSPETTAFFVKNDE